MLTTEILFVFKLPVDNGIIESTKKSVPERRSNCIAFDLVSISHKLSSGT